MQDSDGRIKDDRGTEKKVNVEPVQKKDTREAILHKFTIGDFEGYITAGINLDGTPRDVFIVGNKVGSTTRGFLDTIGILISLALRQGVNLRDITAKLEGTKFEPSGRTGNSDIPLSTSIVDYISRWLERTFDGRNKQTLSGVEDQDRDTGIDKETHGDLCPECGSTLVYGEGCFQCLSCFWSKCG